MPRDWLDNPPPGYARRRTVRVTCPQCGMVNEIEERLDSETGEYWSDSPTCEGCDTEI